MHGGEVFVPKIPSMSIMDLAARRRPGLRRSRTIGIRPGEKLHEVLVSEDEARQTLELDDMFVIQPAHPWWRREPWSEARPVADGFAVPQRRQPARLTVADLPAALEREREWR